LIDKRYIILKNNIDILLFMAKEKKSTIDMIAIILVIIGALNWGLVGLMGLDLVAMLFGTIPILATITYALVGLSGLWILYAEFFKK
jgi:uncharacterized membrane protein YuzA (DUF378 family)